jgi:hypothetical protein
VEPLETLSLGTAGKIYQRIGDVIGMGWIILMAGDTNPLLMEGKH